MDVDAVLGILGVVGVAFTTLWETGGRSALRRRSIKQELELLNALPASSDTRTRLALHISEEIDLYLYRIREQPPPGYALAATVLVAGFVVLTAVRAALPHPDVAVIYVAEAVFVAVALVAYAMILRTWWVRRRTKRRETLLEEARAAGDPPATTANG
jgi:hypothetical protein